MRHTCIASLLLLISHLVMGQIDSSEITIHHLQLPLPKSEGAMVPEPGCFQFAIVSDRTGGHREGVFSVAVDKLNLMRPDFVMSLGDLIEGLFPNRKMAERQWDEIESMVNRLKMPFYYLPGNHDYNNQVLADVWQERLGKPYYHFLHEDVLFLCLNSEDHMKGANDGEIGQNQYEYFAKVLKEHSTVRWTLVFMHQPLWTQETTGYWNSLQELLKNRKHTVFAGHYHRYMKTERFNSRYYVLATTGGRSRLRGPAFGEFDHFMWVTMTSEGPVIANVELSGVMSDDIRLTEGNEFARRLQNNPPVRAERFMIRKGAASDTIHLAFRNDENIECEVHLDVAHHFQINPDLSQKRLSIQPNNFETVQLIARPRSADSIATSSPLQINCEYRFRTEDRAKVKVSFPLILHVGHPDEAQSRTRETEGSGGG